MKLERALSKHIGIRVYDERKHDNSWSVKTKTALDAYRVAYSYRYKRQVQVVATDEKATTWTVRISNEPYPFEEQKQIWNPHRSLDWLEV